MSGEALNVGDVQSVLSLQDEFSEVASKFMDALGDLVPGLEALGIATGVVTAAVGGAAAAIIELGSHGSEVDEVSAGFDRLSGGSLQAQQNLQAMSDAAKGTIDNLTLMEAANHLLAVGAVTSSDSLGTMTAASLVLSKEFGGNATDSMNAISKAMETGRVGRLALSGVTDTTKQAEAAYAAANGITAAQIDAVTKKEIDRQAILQELNSIVAAAGDQELTFGQKIDQGKTAIVNWYNALTVAIAASPDVNAAVDAIGNALKAAFGNGQGITDAIVAGINALARGVTAAVPYVVSFGQGLVTAWGVLVQLAPVFEVIAVGLVAYGVAQLAVTGYTIASTVATTASTFAMQLMAGSFEETGIASMALAVGPLGALAIAIAAIFAAWKIGQTQAVSNWFENLGLMVEGYSASQRAAMIATDNATQSQLKNADATKNLTQEQIDAAKSNVLAGGTFVDLGNAALDGVPKLTAHQQAVQGLIDAWDGASKKSSEVIDAFNRLTPAQLANADVDQALIPVVNQLVAAHQTVPPALMAIYNAALDTTQAITEQGEVLLRADGITTDYVATKKAQGLTEQEIATQLGVTQQALTNYIATLTSLDKINSTATSDLATFTAALQKLGTAIPQSFFTDQVKVYDGIQKIEAGTVPLSASLLSAFSVPKPSTDDYAVAVGHAGMALVTLEQDADALPNILIKAFEGGGSAASAFSALFTKMTNDVFGPKGPLANVTSTVDNAVMSVTSGLGTTVSSLLGTTISSALPAVGALIVPAVTGLFNDIFGGIGGPSPQELAARADLTNFMTSFETTAGNTATAIQPIENQLTQIGYNAADAQTAVSALLNAKTPQAFAAALVPIQAAINQNTNTSTAVTQLTTLVSAYTSAGNVIPASLKSVITSLSTMQGMTADEQTAIKALADNATTDFSTLTSDASGLGISLAQLGPQFAQGQLNEQAAATVQTIQNLAAAGGDMGGILQGATGTMQGYVSQALTYGITLPASLQPYIANLIQAGQLTDQNGTLLTSLSQVNFSASPTLSGLQTINNAAAQLTQTLTGAVAAAGAAAGAGSAAVSGTQTVDSGSGVPTFGPEVFVPSPTLARVGTNGGEMVIHKSTYDAMRGGSGGGNADVVARLDVLNARLASLPRAIMIGQRDAALLSGA